MKVLAFDCETTGLDPERCSIIQFAAILFVDGKEVWNYNERMRPWPDTLIEDEAIKSHGISREKMQRFPHPMLVYSDLVRQLTEYIDKYDTNDKAYPLAYSGQFDMSFVRNWFERCDDNYLGSFIHSRLLLDPLPILRTLDYLGRLQGFKSYKLREVCSIYQIPLHVHDALSDIRATVEVWNFAVRQLSMLPSDLAEYELINQSLEVLSG